METGAGVHVRTTHRAVVRRGHERGGARGLPTLPPHPTDPIRRSSDMRIRRRAPGVPPTRRQVFPSQVRLRGVHHVRPHRTARRHHHTRAPRGPVRPGDLPRLQSRQPRDHPTQTKLLHKRPRGCRDCRS